MFVEQHQLHSTLGLLIINTSRVFTQVPRCYLVPWGTPHINIERLQKAALRTSSIVKRVKLFSLKVLSKYQESTEKEPKEYRENYEKVLRKYCNSTEKVLRKY